MPGYIPSEILQKLEEEMCGIDLSISVIPLSGDRWLASSCMQKAIRRGHTETALRAAMNLWASDRRSFWRRLHVISVEDIGVGCVDTVVKVLTVHESQVWRQRMGDLRVGLFLVKAMSEAVKCRMGDQLFSICSLSPECLGLRQELSGSDNETLAGYVLDDALSLEHRLLSLWLLAGTKRFPSEHLPLRQGSPGMVLDVLRSLPAPTALIESCIGVMHRTQWPLALFMPIFWGEVQKHASSLCVRHDPLPGVPHLEGIPVYGADQFTRIGKHCLGQLKKTIPILKPYNARQLGLTLFYIEGEKTDKTLSSSVLDEYRRAGELADIDSTGLCVPEYLGLKECMSENLSLLHDIRQKALKRLLDGGME